MPKKKHEVGFKELLEEIIGGKKKPVKKKDTEPLKFSGKLIVDYLRYGGWRVHLDAGDELTVNIHVVRGANVDIFLMNDNSYERYRGGLNFPFIKEASALNARGIRYRFTAPSSGDYYLVLDNTGQPLGGAEPDLFNNSGRIDAKIMLTGVKKAEVFHQQSPTR